MINNNNNIMPYFRKDTSNLLTISAATAIALVLMSASPLLPLSNPLLLQPVQAQTTVTFKTPTPASGTYSTEKNASITFDAQGGTLIRNNLETTGTFQITNRSNGQVLSSGSIWRVEGDYLTNTNPNSGLERTLYLTPEGEDERVINTSCSNSASNDISLVNASNSAEIGDFSGAVECSSSSSSSSEGGGNTTSYMTGPTATQDSDGDRDGIPDSSDKCTHNSNPRCFKEGDTTSTTQSSTTSVAGNQTRQ